VTSRSRGRQKILPMEGYEEGFLSGRIARFVQGWSLSRAKVTFVVSTILYSGLVLYTHFVKWPVTLLEGLAFVAGASTTTAILAFFSKRVPDFDFD
jgi:hypothetical protein